jgi:T-complex protein 1 subunit beta
MNKILQSGSTGEINVTNDGATILKAIQLDNAAAKILVNLSKVQDDEVGDGTTSVCVLAAELFREAERLIAQKIHPQTIVEGYRIASLAALKALEKRWRKLRLTMRECCLPEYVLCRFVGSVND